MKGTPERLATWLARRLNQVSKGWRLKENEDDWAVRIDAWRRFRRAWRYSGYGGSVLTKVDRIGDQISSS
jgi:hypothetical protein